MTGRLPPTPSTSMDAGADCRCLNLFAQLYPLVLVIAFLYSTSGQTENASHRVRDTSRWLGIGLEYQKS